MLRAYVYNDEKKVWLEEESLLMHDLCAILDEDEKILYLWKGPKSSSALFDKSYKSLKTLSSSYSNLKIQLIKLDKKIPPNIKNKIDTMLNSLEMDDDVSMQFTRISSIRIFFIMSLSIFILSILSLWNFLQYFNLLNWNGNLIMNPNKYQTWINTSKMLIIICSISLIINLVIGIIENEHQAIVFSTTGIMVCLGIIIYLNQGIYIFLFQNRSSSSIYIISQSDINWFCITILLAELIYLVPYFKKFISFSKKYGSYIF